MTRMSHELIGYPISITPTTQTKETDGTPTGDA